jgi:hypothetical protein
MVHNSQPETLKLATFHWREGESNRFEFAVLASEIVGSYEEGATKELANKIKRSVTTVQNFAKVGQLWNAMLRAYPSQSEILREELPVSFWLPVARQWSNGEMTLDGVYSWFVLCQKEGWTVEQFRSHLPTSGGHSEFVKDVNQFKARLSTMAEFAKEKFVHGPAFDINPLFYSQFMRITKLFLALAEKVVNK